MADWTLSIVIIVPADLREKANRLSCALGHDVLPGNTFVVPLSSDGETVTHYGTRTQAKQAFVTDVANAQAGIIPEGVTLADFDLTEQDVLDLFAVDEDDKPVMLMDVRTDGEITTHFDEVIATHGLLRISQ